MIRKKEEINAVIMALYDKGTECLALTGDETVYEHTRYALEWLYGRRNLPTNIYTDDTETVTYHKEIIRTENDIIDAIKGLLKYHDDWLQKNPALSPEYNQFAQWIYTLQWVIGVKKEPIPNLVDAYSIL